MRRRIPVAERLGIGQRVRGYAESAERGGGRVLDIFPALRPIVGSGERAKQRNGFWESIMTVFIGSKNSDNVTGSDMSDTLFGGGGSDTLSGGAGADSIGAGTDSLGAGTSANDMTFLFGGDDADTIYGGNGHDYIFGNMGADSLVAGAGSDTIYGGNDVDHITTARATAQSVDFISGDNGDDIITVGTLGSQTVLGGMGNDSITAGAGDSGSTELLFGNQGNDTIASSSTGDTSIFGGQGNDVLSLTASGANEVDHYVFGNQGNDTITVTGGFNSVFGGQGNDTIMATGGNDVLHGDLGNDTITITAMGGETIYGGMGGDSINAGASGAPHMGAADYYVIGTGESTAQADSSMTNGSTTITTNGRGGLDVITGFAEGSDHIVLAGHNNLNVVGSMAHPQNVTVGAVTTTAVAPAVEGANAGYDAAYDYAYGNSTSGATSHFGNFEYVEVHVTSGVAGQTGTYLFTNDANHTAVFLAGTTTDLATNDILAG